MPTTTLDARTALVVIDLQRGTLARPMAHPVEDVVAHAAMLADTFRRHDLPVVITRSLGTPAGRTTHGEGARTWPEDYARPVPELTPQPGDLDVPRATWGAFAGGDLDSLLRERGVTQVVLTGVATSFGVESTAREAYDLGFHVVVATDAVTDLSLDSHTRAMSAVFPVLGQVATSGEVMALLDTP